MATSGTVGLTRIDTIKLLEKVTRRCGLGPQMLTPELVDTAMDSLFMLLLSLSNRGLNLWCIDKQIIPLQAGRATYTLPAGTQDILNLLHCVPSETDTGTIVRFGVKFSVLPTLPYELQKSDDGITWTTVALFDVPSSTDYDWYDLDPAQTAEMYQIVSNGTVENLLLASKVREITVSQLNRDDYTSQPDKTKQSNMVTSFYFEKLLEPKITLWPVPSDDTAHLVLYRYRQIQDIGSLTQEVEIPSRWYEAVSWQWAARLAFELPGVDAARRAEVVQMAQGMVIEVEGGETDNAPVYFAPNISVYTR